VLPLYTFVSINLGFFYKYIHNIIHLLLDKIIIICPRNISRRMRVAMHYCTKHVAFQLHIIIYNYSVGKLNIYNFSTEPNYCYCSRDVCNSLNNSHFFKSYDSLCKQSAFKSSLHFSWHLTPHSVHRTPCRAMPHSSPSHS